MVFSDVNYLSNSAPPAAAEWSSLLRPLRGREPEGMWNLLSIVREMYRRCDRNAIRLLEIITEECMACDQILVWWFNTKLSLLVGTNGHNGGKHSNTHSNSNASQHACSSLCDEIVILWRLAALNPGLAPDERDMLHAQFTAWHLKILDRIVKCRVQSSSYSSKHQQHLRTDAELFVGFKPAIEACYLDWEDYPILGITHTQDTNPMYHCPFTCFKHTESKSDVISHVNSSQAVLSANHSKHYNYIISDHNHQLKRNYRPYNSSSNGSNSSSDSVNVRLATMPNERDDCNRSSASSEGFCENENDDDGIDSSGGGGSAADTGVNDGNESTDTIVNINDALSDGDDSVIRSKSPSTMARSKCGHNENDSQGSGGCESSISSSSSSNNNSLRRTNSTNLTKANLLMSGDSSDLLQTALTPNSHSMPAKTENSSSSSISSSGTGVYNSNNQSIEPEDGSIFVNKSKSNALKNAVDICAIAGCTSAGSTPMAISSQNSNQKSANAGPSKTVPISVDSSKPSTSSSTGSSSSMLATPSTSKAIPSTSSIVQAQILAAKETKDSKATRKSTANASATVAKEEEGERRPSKDESLSSSGSQQSVDEYNIYCYDASKGYQQRLQDQYAIEKARIEQGNKNQIFSNIRPTEDAWDILFARAEGLHAHGHGREACILAVRLAEEMLANPPNLMIEIPPPVKQRKGKKQIVNPISHQLSVIASATLAKCAFLCTVLAENSEHYHLGFRICLFALELQRPPASTKPLEVKLANQENDLLNLLKRIPLGVMELRVIRERAEQLRDGMLRSRGEALLPIMLASFIFDALVIPSVTGKEMRMKVMNNSSRTPSDENLGFEAAVAALGLKANVSEAEHPLLCEGTRRQRGDLALTLLYYYKDEPRKIAKIMEKLLDREIHTLIKTPLLPSYYSTNPPVRTPATQPRRDEHELNAHYANEHYQNEYGGNGGAGAGSRPHSSTSAELDISMNALTISQPGYSSATLQQPMGPTITNTSTRLKDSRYKGKRAYPSIPNQPSEASAHFMFESAKNVLTKAGGTSSTSLFTQATTNQNHHGPHKTLHMCAFQLGLYALGLHNCVSPNWLSRTYSSHVSWILGQAMEIGAPAISFLIDTWEGHLTPPEATGMADRASRGWDSNMVYPSAELALSVLPHSAALNPNEIQRAILQCKEQSDQMLERACLTVENAAKGGGVYPEVLFQVARYWYELYLKNSPGGGEHEPHDDSSSHLDHNMQSLMEHHEMQQQMQQQSQQSQQAAAQMQQPQTTSAGPPSGPQVVVTTAPPPPFQSAVTTLAPVGMSPYGPYSFPCQGIYHHHNISYPHNQMQMYLSAPPQGFQYPQPAHGNAQQTPQPQFVQPVGSTYQPMPHPPIPSQGYPPMPCGPNGQPFQVPMQVPPPPPNSVQMQPNMQYFGPPPPGIGMNPPPQSNVRSQQQQGPLPPGQQNQHASHHGMMYPYVQQAPAPQSRQPRHPHHFSPTQLRYLMAAYNVGMLALETLARRVHDDRPQAKYARNPPYGDDVKWLLQISKKLGTQYLHQFCVCAVNSIVSPFVLHDVAIESAHYLARNNPTLVMQHLRSALTPLVQKCQQMCVAFSLYSFSNSSSLNQFIQYDLSCRYIQCIHQKLYHLTAADYEDFASIVLAARAAFQITPEGNAQFKDWLQSIRRCVSFEFSHFHTI